MTRRLAIYLAATFAVTWTSWGILVPLARARTIVYGHLPFMLLYALGGLGPTIAAYVAVLATPTRSSLVEFHRRLFRWRVAGQWYVIAVGLPVALALVSVGIAILADPDSAPLFSVRPWYMFVPLILFMVAGGGLEELGWRGVAQPEMERRLGRPTAAVLVGLVWSFWHLPLFVLPGVGQYGTNFPIFAIGVVGGALILAWLYARTGSILLCIVFHASLNAIAALGLEISSRQGVAALLDACFRVVVGALLLAVGSAPSNTCSRRRSARS
jgi:membrane protease YdiL (CAAX protease family)